jgi:hypothetical protein
MINWDKHEIVGSSTFGLTCMILVVNFKIRHLDNTPVFIVVLSVGITFILYTLYFMIKQYIKLHTPPESTQPLLSNGQMV